MYTKLSQIIIHFQTKTKFFAGILYAVKKKPIERQIEDYIKDTVESVRIFIIYKIKSHLFSKE